MDLLSQLGLLHTMLIDMWVLLNGQPPVEQAQWIAGPLLILLAIGYAFAEYYEEISVRWRYMWFIVLSSLITANILLWAVKKNLIY